MATPSVDVSAPSLSLFAFPPSAVPSTVPPPTAEFTYPTPFAIPATVFSRLLAPAFPITAALIFAGLVSYLNGVNRERGHQPWAISKTGLFYVAVVAHNLFMALYSGWTVVGMWKAVQHVWPQELGHNPLATAVDALCKIHGPRGLGNGVAYNTTTNIWTSPNEAVNVTPAGIPDNTDLGRFWNEGLAFYGWLFYLSKFYEVVDTLIHLAKGKQASGLQVFHHAGSIVSLWAGVRYMSPPVWLWVLLNAGVHTLRYSYYALKSVSVPVPRAIKGLITTLQPLQFGIGTLFALAHLFISYKTPVSIPYLVTPSISSAVSAASSAASSAVTSVATAASSAGIANLLRKVALRAAGEEGLAENVPLRKTAPILKADSIVHGLREMVRQDVKYRTEEQMVPCIDTSGQAFAIWLNVLYLLPLAWLFVRYFQRSYQGHTSTDTHHSTQLSMLQRAGRDAAKGVQRQLDEEPLPLPEQAADLVKAVTKAAENVVAGLEKEVMEEEEEEEGPASRLGNDREKPREEDAHEEDDGELVNGESAKEGSVVREKASGKTVGEKKTAAEKKPASKTNGEQATAKKPSKAQSKSQPPQPQPQEKKPDAVADDHTDEGHPDFSLPQNKPDHDPTADEDEDEGPHATRPATGLDHPDGKSTGGLKASAGTETKFPKKKSKSNINNHHGHDSESSTQPASSSVASSKPRNARTAPDGKRETDPHAEQKPGVGAGAGHDLERSAVMATTDSEEEDKQMVVVKGPATVTVTARVGA
ncbi:MAG: hypothetical protein M1826_004129 [Phylliscum demangeonii]|nr:MAG: hypothetical protein M1826_004129 [Phylliscum demangeonii]